MLTIIWVHEVYRRAAHTLHLACDDQLSHAIAELILGQVGRSTYGTPAQLHKAVGDHAFRRRGLLGLAS